MKKIIIIVSLLCSTLAFSAVHAEYGALKEAARVKTSTTASEILFFADVYPNPADDYVFIQLPEKLEKDLKVEVMSFIGNKMDASTVKVSSNLYKVNIASIPSGHYYLLLTLGKEKELKKFIKK